MPSRSNFIWVIGTKIETYLEKILIINKKLKGSNFFLDNNYNFVSLNNEQNFISCKEVKLGTSLSTLRQFFKVLVFLNVLSFNFPPYNLNKELIGKEFSFSFNHVSFCDYNDMLTKINDYFCGSNFERRIESIHEFYETENSSSSDDNEYWTSKVGRNEIKFLNSFFLCYLLKLPEINIDNLKSLFELDDHDIEAISEYYEIKDKNQILKKKSEYLDTITTYFQISKNQIFDSENFQIKKVIISKDQSVLNKINEENSIDNERNDKKPFYQSISSEIHSFGSLISKYNDIIYKIPIYQRGYK